MHRSFAVVLAVCCCWPQERAPAQASQFMELRKDPVSGTNSAYALAAGDFDRDGDVDLVAGIRGGAPALLRNDGRGRFAAGTLGGGYLTHGAAAGDFDRDGNLDVVLATLGQDRLLLGAGTGGFADATATRLPADSDHSLAVAAGDVDGDGDLDLVFGNGDYNGQTGVRDKLYLNDGTGRFADATATRLPPDADTTLAIALGDVDGDGDLDILFGNAVGWFSNVGQPNRLYLNDGRGFFRDASATHLAPLSDATHALLLADLDRDGDLDLVEGNFGPNRLCWNDGQGRFFPAATSLPPDPDFLTTALAVADINGDGWLDVIAANFRQPQRVYKGLGLRRFVDATAELLPPDDLEATAVAAIDIDGDRDTDLVFGNNGYPLHVCLNDESRRFVDLNESWQIPGLMYLTPGWAPAAIADLDRDGDPDVVCLRYAAHKMWLNEAGLGRLRDVTATHLPPLAEAVYSVAVGDVDGDGDLDLVLGRWGRNKRLWLNDGSGRFSDATAGRMPVDTDATLAVVLGDVDGDGDLDLVCGNRGTQNRLYRNQQGVFTDATATALPADTDSTSALALADVDRDGDLDLLIANGANNPNLVQEQNKLYLNNGSGRFTDATATNMPVAIDPTLGLGVGDFDADGDLDVFFGNGGQGTTPVQDRLYANDGSGKFVDVTAACLPVDNDYAHAVAVGDVDDDGDLDIVYGQSFVWPPPPSPALRFLINDGRGRFAQMPWSGSYRQWSVALADLDLDGDLDVLAEGGLFFNMKRHLFATGVARLGDRLGLRFTADPQMAPAARLALPLLAGAALPVGARLAPFGLLRLHPAQIVVGDAVSIPAGTHALRYQAIPNVTALVGSTIHAQALVLPSQRLEDARLTNLVAERILR